MEKHKLEGLVRGVALLICKGFYWGEHLAEDRETLQVARTIVFYLLGEFPNSRPGTQNEVSE